MHVVFDETSTLDPGRVVVDDLVGNMIGLLLEPTKETNGDEENQRNESASINSNIEGKINQSNEENSQHLPQHLQAPPSNVHNLPRDWTFVKDYPQDFIIGETSKGVSTQNPK